MVCYQNMLINEVVHLVVVFRFLEAEVMSEGRKRLRFESTCSRSTSHTKLMSGFTIKTDQ